MNICLNLIFNMSAYYEYSIHTNDIVFKKNIIEFIDQSSVFDKYFVS
jgi:hypothetical protein